METPTPRLNLIVAVTGASGALYAHAFLRALALGIQGESALIVSPAALRVHRQESGGQAREPVTYLAEALGPAATARSVHGFRIERPEDIGARAASGSARYDGMVVMPCSMKSLSGIASGYTGTLVERAADVCLKERRPLILVPRETPLSLIHLRNMTAVTEAGAIVLPASPGFYQKPATLEDLANFIVGRVLSLLGVEHDLYAGWQGGPDADGGAPLP